MTFDYDPAAPPVRPSLWRSILDHNPFYLLSAACMLGGCIALTNSLSFTSIPQRRLLILLATLNCYEVLVVALGVWLIAIRKLRRDGSMLFGIEAMFLSDLAWLNSEIVSMNWRLGAWLNLALFALATLKLILIFRALRIPLRGPFVLLLSEIALLSIMPIALKRLSDIRGGSQDELTLFGFWWIVAIIPVIAMLTLRRLRTMYSRQFVLFFSSIAFLSLTLHLGLSYWVFKVAWHPTNLAPIFLGMSLPLGMLNPRWQFWLPVVAVLLSVTHPEQLVVGGADMAITPLHLSLLCATLIWLHGWWVHGLTPFLLGAVLITLGAIAKASFPLVRAIGRSIGNLWERVIPTTPAGWGAFAVAMSFLLLGLGVIFSILRTPSESPNDS